ncbi:MAG: hypothetical protein OEN56_02055 [Gemmatimonadota bacterium]|nr:hypothetical protein [Gemmatimonadota bacterium]
MKRSFVEAHGVRGAVAVILACALLTGLGPAPVEGQGLRGEEARLLREAAARESRGDYAGAEEALRRLLVEVPNSSGGLFALERVLGAQGQVVEILPAVYAYLEQDPESPGVRSLALRVLTDVDSLDAVRAQAEAWLALDPQAEVAYREVARVYERAFDADEAMSVYRRGRTRIGEDEVFALEIGDLLAAEGDYDAAASEWTTAVGDDGGQAVTIARRIVELEAGRDVLGPLVVDALSDSNLPPRRRAGARIALDVGLTERADRGVRSVAADLEGRARASFLADAARRARDGGMVALASWAYDELGDDATSPAERRQFDQRIVDVALAAGDTLTALDAQWRLVESFSARSVDRRRATARAIQLEGSGADPTRLRDLLADFRDTFENAPELDGLAATVASALHARGDLAGAGAVLEGVSGPLSSMERGYLLLAEGDLENGRTALLLALTGLPPADATPVIQYTGLLGRVSPAAAQALAIAGVTAHRGEAGRAASELAAQVDAFDSGERAGILAEAARIAARGDARVAAADIRTLLVEEYPDAPETAEAALALARYHARTPDGVDEAVRLLENLIAQRPNAAIVPDARLELQRLRGVRR